MLLLFQVDLFHGSGTNIFNGLFVNSVDAHDQWHLSKLVSLPGLGAVRRLLRGWLLDIIKMARRVYVLNSWIICIRVVLVFAECILNESKIHAAFALCTSGPTSHKGMGFSFYPVMVLGVNLAPLAALQR